MAYIKNIWKNQNVERPRTYEMQNNSDGSVTLIDSFGNVTELGTPVNEDNMNHIEEGIAAGSFTKYNANGVYEKNDLVTVIEDDSPVIYKSLLDNNTGNYLSDATYWEKISFGGSGLEVCDIGTALYVDETKGLRRYLNGQIVDINTNTQAFLNRLLQIKTTNPDYFTTEDNWQTEATLNIDGCVYKFVLNYSGDDIVSVRLPKYPDYVEINVGGTLPVVGNGGEIGVMLAGEADTRFLQNTNQTRNGIAITGNQSAQTVFGITTDPTKSGIQTTLKQTKLKMRYFIQIATGAETENNIINTLENVNGFTLLESKYSDKPLYNEGWLLSNGQWNAGGVYVTVYEGLQVEYNTEIEAGTTVTLPSGTSYTKRGLSVKLSTEEYTDYDFVLNTSDETFRLPLEIKQKFYNAISGDYPVVGNGMSLGLTNSSQTFGLVQSTNDYNFSTSAYGVSVGASATANSTTTSKAIGVTTNSTKSGLVAKISSTEVTGLYLYFYVGETVQNANIIDAGRIGEQLANKVDRNEVEPLKTSYIIDTYVNGTSGYRVWSDGYCEQWGQINTASTETTISLLKTFSNTNYTVQATFSASSGGGYYTPVVRIKNTNSIIFANSNWNSTGRGFIWKASGYMA